jgi:hypothetical protein
MTSKDVMPEENIQSARLPLADNTSDTFDKLPPINLFVQQLTPERCTLRSFSMSIWDSIGVLPMSALFESHQYSGDFGCNKIRRLFERKGRPTGSDWSVWGADPIAPEDPSSSLKPTSRRASRRPNMNPLNPINDRISADHVCELANGFCRQLTD